METTSFLWVEVGAAESSSDVQIFKHSNLRHKIEDGSIGFPESEPLGIGGPKVNVFINASALKLWLMKPYSRHGMGLKERVFNCRISQGRRVVDNVFGILASRFRIFQSLLQQEPPMVTRLVMACLVLHNLLRIRYPTGQQADFGREGQHPIALEDNDIPYDGCNPMAAAKTQRNILRDYFMNEGQVSGQIDRI